MNIDDLIRETVRSQEELAVDPDRIRAGLPARAARRQRARTRAMLAAVAAGVAVAVAVPVVILGDSGTVVTATVPQATIPLGYRITWLPDGMGEEIRDISFLAPGTGRGWESTAPDSVDHSNPGVHLFVTPTAPDDVDRTPNVDINGVPGYYGGGSVIWEVGDTGFLVVAPESFFTQEEALRIARSVEPDPTPMRLPLQFGWLPDGSAEWTRKSEEPGVRVVGDSPTRWEATVLVYDSQRYVQASLTTNEYMPLLPEPNGEEVIINGRTAQLSQSAEARGPVERDYQASWLLTMDLGDGRHLTVQSGTAKNSPATPPLSRDDMIRIVEQIQLDPNPDVGWIG